MRFGLAMGALLLASPAQAQGSAEPDSPLAPVIRTIDSLAFDPSTFFEYGFLDLARIRYRGDDWSWPVYSIAIHNGCEAQDAPLQTCGTRRIARMARAPIGPRGAERPRWRGSDLGMRIFRSGARSEDAIKAQLDGAGIEWLEADLQTCPGAMDMLARASDARWGPPPPAPPADEIIVRMHADTAEVQFEVPGGWVIWSGDFDPGTPSRWAIDFAALIEPCWRPAKAPTPWRRVPGTD